MFSVKSYIYRMLNHCEDIVKLISLLEYNFIMLMKFFMKCYFLNWNKLAYYLS